jgi:hypothetical protein
MEDKPLHRQSRKNYTVGTGELMQAIDDCGLWSRAANCTQIVHGGCRYAKLTTFIPSWYADTTNASIAAINRSAMGIISAQPQFGYVQDF